MPPQAGNAYPSALHFSHPGIQIKKQTEAKKRHNKQF